MLKVTAYASYVGSMRGVNIRYCMSYSRLRDKSSRNNCNARPAYENNVNMCKDDRGL